MRHRTNVIRVSVATVNLKMVTHDLTLRIINRSVDGFYIRGSVHRKPRLKKSNEMQQNADIYLLLNGSTCFGLPSRTSSGVHKTVVAASGTDHTI